MAYEQEPRGQPFVSVRPEHWAVQMSARSGGHLHVLEDVVQGSGKMKVMQPIKAVAADDTMIFVLVGYSGVRVLDLASGSAL